MKHSLKIALLASSSLLVACGSSDDSTSDNTDGRDNSGSQANYVAFDATQGKVNLDLESGHTVTDAEQWHMSYQKYVGFSVNGGISGDGDVSACVAHTPEGVYDADNMPVQAEFEALTYDNTLADFDAVNIASCEESDFVTDSIKTQIELLDWASYDYSNHSFSLNTSADNGWILQSASKNDLDSYEYARVKVASLDYESGVNYAITFSTEMWDTNTETFLAAQVSPELNFTSERVYWDMETNAVVTSSDDWDLSITINGRSWDIQTNGGSSGTGDAAIGFLIADSAELVTNPAASHSGDVYKYDSDAAESALNGPGSYGAFSYGVAGGHNMWPNFTTYLFKDGERYFKAQVISNYGEDGTLTSGNLYVRYEEVTE